jgi:hypothetical protein
VWNEAEVRARFRKRAAELEARLPSLKGRGTEGASMRALHDESLAKLVVYRAALNGTALRTREETLGILAVLRRDPPIPPEAMEAAAFPERIRHFIDALVGQYRG